MAEARIEISQPDVTDHYFYMKPPSWQLSAIQDDTPGWEYPIRSGGLLRHIRSDS